MDGVALAQLAQDLAEDADHTAGATVAARSPRNRLSGLVTRVVRDTMMAQVEIHQTDRQDR